MKTSVWYKMGVIGNPWPSSLGADCCFLVRDRSKRHSLPVDTVRRMSSMAASSALDWPENERASAALMSQIALGDDIFLRLEPQRDCAANRTAHWYSEDKDTAG